MRIWRLVKSIIHESAKQNHRGTTKNIKCSDIFHNHHTTVAYVQRILQSRTRNSSLGCRDRGDTTLIASLRGCHRKNKVRQRGSSRWNRSSIRSTNTVFLSMHLRRCHHRLNHLALGSSRCLLYTSPSPRD